jgi:GTPase SAR1 family protein
MLCCAVYDVTNASSLENLGSKWMQDFKEYGRLDAVQMVVGNKIDLVSTVP